MIDIQGLRFAFAGEAPLIADWSARIDPGITLLYGDTGAGKSVLLRLLAGVQAADAGRLQIGDAVLAGSPARYQAQLFFVDPGTQDFDQMTARNCLAQLAGADADMGVRDALVEGFGLAPHLDKSLYMLSTGSKRKVWLTAALAGRRPVVLLDEPTAALDQGSVRCLWEALTVIGTARQRTVLLASSEAVNTLPLAARIDLPLN
ncbi:cytochrome c biogenesis ATP-binding export protein CcmA [Pseudorhodoferax aquiterrae]|uniref:Cytochrome c biogenesis ATP-binding export protein CcmA n=1 Tax=Pseudorhodoferax aquiterrae TaxID=747304 RepID=A0ABQ3G342_9BURK|nr:ATP-binding cassette domain-containing protein [Pseudorhodoferax aquiterrae]GHC86583.1 cytochrome c biogenesis ATP-binding export protein CcmA [Pseudorhodoferax aquiterrae]